MFQLVSAIFTVAAFALTKGVWIYGAVTLVRKYNVVEIIKARVQESSDF